MGNNTIPARANGQTIDEVWFNVLRAVMGGDLVPRNTAGVATDQGGDLGSSSIAWLNAWMTTLKLLNGTKKISLSAPAGLAADYAMTLPGALPASTLPLQISPSGILTFAKIPNGGLAANSVGLTELATAVQFNLRRSVYAANDTWVCPTGVSVALVLARGGSGGGGGAKNPANSGGGGGGSGTISTPWIVPVTAGVSYSITIGAAGAAGAANGGNGGAGGDSTFSTLATGKGGAGGLGSASGTGGTGGVANAGSGGSGGAGGTGGGSPTAGTTGGNGVRASGGAGGASNGNEGGGGGGGAGDGAGGAGSSTNGGVGVAGGGGAGGCNGAAGGAGIVGQIIVAWIDGF